VAVKSGIFPSDAVDFMLSNRHRKCMHTGMHLANELVALMRRMILVAGSLLPMTKAGVPVRLDLAPGGGFDVRYEFSTGQYSDGRDALSGHILADVDINATGVVTRCQLTGGRVAHENTTLEILLNTSFLGIAKVRITTTDVVTQPLTNRGPGNVDPITGALNNTEHRMISNEGTILTRYSVGNTTVLQETRNLATQPDDTPLVGNSTVTAVLLAETSYWKRYRIDFHHTRDVVRTQSVTGVPIIPAGTTLNISEDGEFSASGEVVVPGDGFVTWAATFRHVADVDFETRDPVTGQPLLVMYALGAGAGPWTLPMDLDPASATMRIQCPLPLRAAVVWEYSAGLAPNAWQTLPGGRMEPGLEGEQVILLPSSDRLFLRAYVPVP
jgi:hypothetical protein